MKNCIFCGGSVKEEEVTFVYDDDGKYFFIERVPAEVCTQCGEKSYSPQVSDEIIRLARKKMNPTKTIQVPVFDYGLVTG